MFDTSNLRHLDPELHCLEIRELRLSPLILVKDGAAYFANSRTEKDRLVEKFDETSDLMLFPWCGQYRTDVFSISKADLAKHYSSR